MERSRLVSGMIGFFVFLVLVISILTMSLCLGIRKNVKAAIFGTGSGEVEAMASQDDMSEISENEDTPIVLYSAILADGEIYIYDSYGTLYDKLAPYAEFMTESDKNLLSDGVDFYSEEELESFMNDFS